MQRCSVFSFSLFLLVVTLAFHSSDATNRPLLFIFGDSIVDVGTNNFRPGNNPALEPPYGIDYPTGEPTGRFSNGYNLADELAMAIGYKESPRPYLAINESSFKNVEDGVNFASGGSGILDTTCTGPKGSCVPLREQIGQFESFLGNITADRVNQALLVFSDGGNDILTGLFAWDKDEFVDDLVSEYVDHLKDLYALGARKFGIVGVGPVGCTPSVRALNVFGECNHDLNEMARSFFNKMKIVLEDLRDELHDMQYSIGDLYHITNEAINHASEYDFKQVKEACCGSGYFNGQGPCNSAANLCEDRDDYIFWDGIHPTQQAAKLVANKLYDGGIDIVSPINFRQLAKASNGVKAAADLGAQSKSLSFARKTKYNVVYA